MGYYTKHELSVIEGGQELISELRAEYDEAKYALDDNGKSGERCKWYDHDNNLINFSKKYPYALFKLEGEGDECGDIWASYYRDGKMQRCKAKITFDKFDEKLLA